MPALARSHASISFGSLGVPPITLSRNCNWVRYRWNRLDCDAKIPMVHLRLNGFDHAGDVFWCIDTANFGHIVSQAGCESGLEDHFQPVMGRVASVELCGFQQRRTGELQEQIG